MSLKVRILAGFMILYTVGILLIMELVVSELRPRYLEAVEESLNDTAYIVASLLEAHTKNEHIVVTSLDKTFDWVYEKRFQAQIYDIVKEKVSLSVYVTDSKGIVIFDTRKPGAVGEDYSKWRDVLLTLKGEYGARATRKDPGDPASSILHVAAPVYSKGKIIGVVTVVKEQESVSLFINLARRRFLLAGGFILTIILALSMAMTQWLNRPLDKLTKYVSQIRESGTALLPETGVPELQHLALALEQMVIELEGKKYIEEYVQTLTHELKSPLASIRGAAELLNEDMDPEDRKRFAENICRETIRVTSFVERMLQLASVEGRTALTSHDNIDICSILKEIDLAMEPQFNQKNCQLVLKCPEVSITKGEEFLIRQTLVNLVQNSLDASPEGSLVMIAVSHSVDCIIIEIENQGKLIPDYALDKIFERFYSLPSKKGEKGTGLGLPFAKEAVTLHGGTINVENMPPDRIKTRVSLPV